MSSEGTFNGIDGAELFYRVIKPLAAPKAAVILVHGHGDHSGGLQNISASLVENEYIVYAFDLRGHGKSSGKRGFISSWRDFRGDLNEFRKLVAKEQFHLPMYLVGHSIGGLITLDYSIDHSSGISGIVAIAPAISYEVTPLERFCLTIMGKLKPDYRINRSSNFKLSSKDPAVLAKLNPDGLRHNTATPGLGCALIEAISRVVNHSKSIKLPLLLQYGLEDKITPPIKLRHFFHLVASKDKQVFEYTLGRHRPFDEVGREMFLNDLVWWLDQQIGKNQKAMYSSTGYQ